MQARASTRVVRTVLVKGGNVVALTVKVLREHASYVVCEEVRGLKTGKKSFAIRKGAILVRRKDLDRDGIECYMIFNDGVYAAIRSQGFHVPDTQGVEGEKITVQRASLKWALQQTWYLSARSSDADVGAYRSEVESVAQSLRRARDDDKRRTRDQSARAANHRDRRGRVNFSSRSPIVWSADFGLIRRTRTVGRIRPRIAVRHCELIALADLAWDAKESFETEITQALRWGASDVRPMDADIASRLAARFEKLAGSLRSVSVAPYSRRGFPRIATDIERAVAPLLAGDYVAARRLIDRCQRAFLMMNARRALEEACTVASRVAKARIVPSKADADALVDAIDRVEFMLCADGGPIDADFDHPVIADRVRPNLIEARNAALAIGGYRAHDVYRALEAAAAPL